MSWRFTSFFVSACIFFEELELAAPDAKDFRCLVGVVLSCWMCWSFGLSLNDDTRGLVVSSGCGSGSGGGFAEMNDEFEF